MLKRLKRFGPILALILCVLAGLAWGANRFVKNAIESQLGRLREAGVHVRVRSWAFGALVADVEVPEKGLKLERVRVGYRLRGLRPLAIGLDWENEFSALEYGALVLREARVSLEGVVFPGFERDAAFELSASALRDGERLKFFAKEGILRRSLAGELEVTSRIAIERAELKAQGDLRFRQEGSAQIVSFKSGAGCLTVGATGQFESCELEAQVATTPALIATVALRARGTGAAWPELRALDVRGKVDLTAGAPAGYLALAGRGANEGSMASLRSELKIDFTPDAKLKDAVRVKARCPAPCLDVRALGRGRLVKVGAIRADALWRPGRTGSRASVVIEKLDGRVLQEWVKGLAPVEFIVKANASFATPDRLRGDLLLREGENNFDIEAEWAYRLAASLFDAQVKGRFSFSPLFQPSYLFPDVKETLQNVIGYLSIALDLKVANGELGPMPITAKIVDGYGQYDGFPFAKAKLDSRWMYDVRGFHSLGVQELTFDKFGKELALQKILARFELKPGWRLVASELGATFCEGAMQVAPFEWDFDAPKVKTRVDLSKMNLGVCLQALKFERLSGQGLLTGVIPIEYTSDGLTIRAAEFKNIGPGIVRYKDPSAANVKARIDTLGDFNNLLQQGQQVMAFKALDNFHYEHFRLSGNRAPTTGMDLRLELKGQNPDLARGQPFVIDIPITGGVETLLLQSLVQSMVERSGWEKQIQKIMKKRKESSR